MFSPAWSTNLFSNRNASMPTKAVFTRTPRKVMMFDFLVDRFQAFISKLYPQVPIFVHIWFHAPHHPVIASPKLAQDCMRGKICTTRHSRLTKEVDYYGVVHALDSAIGRLRRILRNEVRASNTLFIVTSDNGALNANGDDAGSVAPFRGVKGSILEGGHRVIGLFEWP